MRIRRLVVEGFGPFAHRQEIDFAALDAAGLFLITGRTGSGKSSILDAVCFALYGGAPRYDGAKARLRSDHARPEDPTRVEVEFDAGGERWRVVRSPEYQRPKQRGEGFTTQREQAQVYRREGDEWVGLAARATDLPEILEPVLQLNREQFLQVILLAQGRFQEFLRARSEDRVGLLRALFGTQRFARFEAELVQRSKTLQESIAAEDAAVASDLARLAELVDVEPDAAAAGAAAAALRERAAAATDAGRIAQHGFAAADAALAVQVRVADLQRRRADAAAALARLAAADPVIDRDRTRVAAALRALPATPSAARASAAGEARDGADARLAAATEAVGGPVADPAAAAAELDGAIGGLVAAVVEEESLPALQDAVRRAGEGVEAAAAAVDAVRGEQEALPAQRDAAETARRAALALAAGLPAARSAIERAESALRAARTAEGLRERSRAADRRHVAALADEGEAAARTLRLVQARAAGAAALLAETLHDGDACPVCGSTEHPDPAEPGAERVDDEAVARAQTAQDAAARSRAVAADAASALRTDLAAADTAAAGLSVEQAASTLADAGAGERIAEQAQAEVARLDGVLGSLGARTQQLTRRTDDLRRVLGEHEEARAAAVATLRDTERRVEAARDGADRVADRVGRLRRRRDLLRALARAVQAAEDAAAGAAHAEALLAAALADAGFDSLDALRAAEVPRLERESLEAAVRQHDQARAAAAAQLADPDVAAAPHDPADVPTAAQAKAQALDRQREAAQTAADLTARADQAAVLAGRIVAATAATADAHAQLDVVAPLAAAVRGGNAKRMRLEAYVLAARLEQIVAAANLRLATMTDGRYTLRHDDSLAERNQHSGLGLEVMDEHTGRTRQIASLSGGETFLASLALALGLAEVVSNEAGGVRLDTLFVDEGFGSLDRQTLDTAMETLDSLRAGGRVVGLISHVEGMQEDIPAGLHVERGPDGSSSVRLRTPALV